VDESGGILIFPEVSALPIDSAGIISTSSRMFFMEDPIDIHKLKDRGGRRALPDRRQRSSSEHFPERRSYRHRRSGHDRRSMQNQKIRKRKERRREFREKYSG
jgi:hypothetical protein